ncbi:hypothetical protein DFJ74DRAFT_703577 [Hyaloraphidium curvatum]|nr:hypothetical protein DFJ74DRAFT_703577 [Hyaloraphidium curvatum]
MEPPAKENARVPANPAGARRVGTLEPGKPAAGKAAAPKRAATVPVPPRPARTDEDTAKRQEDRRAKLEQFRKERELLKQRAVQQTRKPAVPAKPATAAAPTGQKPAARPSVVVPPKPAPAPKPAAAKPIAVLQQRLADPPSARKSLREGPSLAEATSAVEQAVSRKGLFDSPSVARTDAAVPDSVKRLLPKVRGLDASQSTPIKSLSVEVGLSNFEDRLKSAHKLQRKHIYDRDGSPIAGAHSLPAPAVKPEAPALDPNHASVWIAKARELELLGWWDGAVGCFREAKNRGAFPDDLLEAEFDAFVERMSAAGYSVPALTPTVSVPESPEPAQEAGAPDQPEGDELDHGLDAAAVEAETEAFVPHPLDAIHEAAEEPADTSAEVAATVHAEGSEPEAATQDCTCESASASAADVLPADVEMDVETESPAEGGRFQPEEPHSEHVSDPNLFLTPRHDREEFEAESPASPQPPMSHFADQSSEPESPSMEEPHSIIDLDREDREDRQVATPEGLPLRDMSPIVTITTTPGARERSSTPGTSKSRKEAVEDMVKIYSQFSSLSLGSPSEQVKVKAEPEPSVIAEASGRERAGTPRLQAPAHPNPHRSRVEQLVPIGKHPEAGTMIMLTPARARPRERELLGVPSYVTPVRRSVRTLDYSEQITEEEGGSFGAGSADVKPRSEGEKLQQMLESVDYAFVPNEAVSVDHGTLKHLLQKGARPGTP